MPVSRFVVGRFVVGTLQRCGSRSPRERLDMNDTASVGYTVKTKNREDIIIVSDGKHRTFTDKIEGDFTYGFFSSAATTVSSCRVIALRRWNIRTRLRREPFFGQMFPFCREQPFVRLFQFGGQKTTKRFLLVILDGKAIVAAGSIGR